MKWKTQGDRRRWLRRVESWGACDPDSDSPWPSWRGGLCERGQALPCTEGATGSSRRIFPQKKKTLWGTLGNSPAATAPVSSPPCHRSGNCVHLISGSVPIHRVVLTPHLGGSQDYKHHPGEGAHPLGRARTSLHRDLRLQAPPGAGCPANGCVCTSSQR